MNMFTILIFMVKIISQYFLLDILHKYEKHRISASQWVLKFHHSVRKFNKFRHPVLLVISTTKLRHPVRDPSNSIFHYITYSAIADAKNWNAIFAVSITFWLCCQFCSKFAGNTLWRRIILSYQYGYIIDKLGDIFKYPSSKHPSNQRVNLSNI